MPATPPEPRWLTPAEQQVWRRLVEVLVKVPAALEAQLQRDAGLTHMGYWVLVGLSEAPDRTLRMSELAARSHSSLSRLSHLVARLESRGWVERRRHPDDGRVQLAVLTDAGFAVLAAAAPGHVEQVRALVFDRLTPEQVAALGDVCARLAPGEEPVAGAPEGQS